MTVSLEATCVASVVKIGALPLPSAKKFSAGVAASEGVAFIDGEKQYYFANTTPDLETTLGEIKKGLDKTAAALTKLTSILTDIGAGMAGAGTTPPPTLATDLLDITQAATDLTAISTTVELLKGNLR